MLFKSKKRRTFSYFIPAPPSRRTGYQEKELDRILNYLQDNGYKIIELKASSFSNESMAGVWVFTILEAQNKQAQQLDLNIDYQELVSKLEIKNPDIEHES